MDIQFKQKSGGCMKASFRKFFQPVPFLIILQLMLMAPATAQNYRGLRIKVTDDKDQPVAEATVQIIGIDVGRNFTGKTDKKGEYYKPLGNQPGTYRIVARQTGFKPKVYKENVSPELDETLEIVLKLELGQDYKLPWEMTSKEKAELDKKRSTQKQDVKLSAEVKGLFDNGLQLSKDEKYTEAVDVFGKAIEKAPKQPALFYNRANAYAKLKKYDEALADYDKAIAIAIELKKDDPNFYSQKAMVFTSIGKTDEADKLFQLAAEKAKDLLSPADAAQFHLNRGIALNNGGLTNKAIEAFKQAIEVDPKYAEAYYQLGIALSAKQETMSQAIEALKKYLPMSKKPDHLEIAKQMISALGGK
jgi:tetratricopeptide (TPR) repeat protein